MKVSNLTQKMLTKILILTIKRLMTRTMKLLD
jgi:hypothetical protein